MLERFVLASDEALAVYREKRIVLMQADLTESNPEAEKHLIELGNHGKSLPFVAIFSWDSPEQPQLFQGMFLLSHWLEALQKVAPSKGGTPVAERGDGDGRQEEAVGESAGVAEQVSVKVRPERPTDAAPDREKEAVAWKPFERAAVFRSLEKGANVLIDWTADW